MATAGKRQIFYFLHTLQPDTGAHPTPYPVGTKSSFFAVYMRQLSSI
jgi:hypothetical protein